MKMLIQYLLAALMFCAAFQATAQQSDSPEEVALYEALQDVNALVTAGVSLNDFQARMPDLVVLLDRMKRRGTQSANLDEAVRAFRGSVQPWAEYIKWKVRIERESDPSGRALLVKAAALNQKLRDGFWSEAAMNLSQYAEIKAQQASKAKAEAEAQAAADAKAKADAEAEAAKTKAKKTIKAK